MTSRRSSRTDFYCSKCWKKKGDDEKAAEEAKAKEAAEAKAKEEAPARRHMKRESARCAGHPKHFCKRGKNLHYTVSP